MAEIIEIILADEQLTSIVKAHNQTKFQLKDIIYSIMILSLAGILVGAIFGYFVFFILKVDFQMAP